MEINKAYLCKIEATAWLHDTSKYKVNINLVNMRYKTLGYLVTILKSGRRVTTG